MFFLYYFIIILGLKAPLGLIVCGSRIKRFVIKFGGSSSMFFGENFDYKKMDKTSKN